MHSTKQFLMKKSLLLVFTMLSASTCFSQISIESSDLTSVGDQIIRYADTIPAYGPGPSGPNVTWDFSGAVPEDTAVTTVVTVASTGFQSTFSSSDYAMQGNADSYLFFEHDANTMTTTGAAGDLLGNGDIESPFSDNLLLHEFPRTYQSNFDDTYAFITEADGAGLQTPIPVNRVRLTHTGHVYDTTDAYGTLITPTGTYDAIRVKTVDFTYDLLEFRLLPPPFGTWDQLPSTLDTITTYTWHAKEEMLAIAEFAYDTLDNPARFTYSSVPPVTTVGVEYVDEKMPFALYPQPASDQLFVKGLSQSGNHQAHVFSIDGKMVRNEALVGNSINVSDLKSGMYILRITLSDGTRPEPMKFIVQ
jgi:hypothetical protein